MYDKYFRLNSHPVDMRKKRGSRKNQAALKRRVFVLGAGLSAECGAPVLSKFLDPDFRRLAYSKDAAIVMRFIRTSFPPGASPNIEEVLSHIDRAISRKDSFETLDLKGLQQVRDATVNVIAETLAKIQDHLDKAFGVRNSDKPYRALMAGPERGKQIYEHQMVGSLISDMKKLGMVPTTETQPSDPRARGWGLTYERLVSVLRNEDTIMTLNYDPFLDIAIASSDKFIGLGTDEFHVDYGTEYYNISSESNIACEGPCRFVPRPEWQIGAPKITLLKLHGALNWAICTSCKSLLMTDYTPIHRIGKHIKSLRFSQKKTGYELCCPRFTPQMLIVPPTWMKDYDDFNLRKVWLEALKQLSRADEVIFLGYSFSESDIEIRYLFTRALHMRNGRPWKAVTVVNSGDEAIFERYERFFGNVTKVNTKASEFLQTVHPFTPKPRPIKVVKT